MANANENTITTTPVELPIVEVSKRDFKEEVTTALNGAWFQTKRTTADSVVFAAEATELTLKATANTVEGGILIVRYGKELLWDDIDEFLEDIKTLAGTTDTSKEAEPS